MSSNKLNFLVHLHEPAREILLCSLDAGTLTAFCCVSKSWNAIVNSCEEAWKTACRKLGLIIFEGETREPSYWKGYAVSIIERKIRMKKSTCFSEGPFSIDTQNILAIAYSNNKIAVAFSNRIEVWNEMFKEWELIYNDTIETVRLIMQNGFLVAGTANRLIMSWRLYNDEVHGAYSGPRSSLTSLDCLVDHNIVAASYQNSLILLWNFKSREMVKKIYHRNFMIVKIMLAPKTSEDESSQTQNFLFSVDVDSICLRILKYNPSNITHGNVDVIQISIIPLDLPRRMPDTFTLIGSLLFDGQFLYYPGFSPRVEGNTIGVWDVYEDKKFDEIMMEDEIRGLLAIGKKYMAIHTKDRFGGEEKLRIIKRFLHTEVAFCELPTEMQRLGAFDNTFVTIGETAWLDGLNGVNDEGLLCAYVVTDEGLRSKTWTQRIVQAF